jgi:hypothetical protein
MQRHPSNKQFQIFAPMAQKVLLAGAGDLWTPLLFLLFNGGDLGGRLLAGIGEQQHKSPAPGTLLTYAISRVVLVIGLLLCHVVTPHPWRLPEPFRWAAQTSLNFIVGTAELLQGEGCHFEHA